MRALRRRGIFLEIAGNYNAMLPGPAETVGILGGHTGSDTLLAEENVDLIWGVETNDVSNREWSKLDEDFTNAGYREGITAGKDSAVQEGFDEGFARVGAPLGREVGVLRGAANAAVGFLSSRMLQNSTDAGVLERRKGEVWDVIGSLGRINLEDLVPPDLEAEEHAREHLNQMTMPSDSLLSPAAKANGQGIDELQPVKDKMKLPPDESLVLTKPAVEELNRLRIRLSVILKEIGLDILLA